MANLMRRPKFHARIQWHTWMPWYEFSCILGEMQNHDERAGGMLPPALGIALVTLVAAVLVPQLSFLITVAGGSSIVWALTCANGDGRRLIRGVKVVGLPSPHTFLRLGAEMAADDLTALWQGQPRPAGLLTGPDEEGWTREETIVRYHLWRQVRESLPPADRDTAAIVAAVGFTHEELMDALLAHKLRLADLDTGRQQNLLAPILEERLLGMPEVRIQELSDEDGGINDDKRTAAPECAGAGDVGLLYGAGKTQRHEGLRADEDEADGLAGVGAGQRPSAVAPRHASLGCGTDNHYSDDLEAARGLIDAAAGRPTINGGGHGDE